jgi:hypothetical protein
MKQKGGFGLKKDWKSIIDNNTLTKDSKQDNVSMKEILYNYFFPNSTFKMFTNDSISCITYLVTLKKEKETPFESVRSTQFNIEIRTLLLKFFVTTNGELNYYNKMLKLPNRPNHNGIEITDKVSFNREIYIQNNVYKKSLRDKSSYLEPLCPAILYNDFTTTHDEHNTYWATKLDKPYFDILDEVNGQNIPIPFWPKHLHIGFIAMEYMEGYKTLGELYSKNDHNLNKYVIYAKYEIMRLNKLGFKHNDAHLGNIMINTNMKYYSTKEKEKGKALIIDFGRSTFDMHNNDTWDERIYNEIPHREKFSTGMKTPLSDKLYNKLHRKRTKYSDIFVNTVKNRYDIDLNKLLARFFTLGGRTTAIKYTTPSITNTAEIEKIESKIEHNNITKQRSKMDNYEMEFLEKLENDDDDSDESDETILNTIYGNFFNQITKDNEEDTNRLNQLLKIMTSISPKGDFTSGSGGTNKTKKCKKKKKSIINKTEKKK